MLFLNTSHHNRTAKEALFGCDVIPDWCAHLSEGYALAKVACYVVLGLHPFPHDIQTASGPLRGRDADVCQRRGVPSGWIGGRDLR